MTNPFTRQRTHPLAAALGEAVAPLDDRLAAADAIGFVDWDVKADRLVWDRGAEERFGAPEGSMATFDGWASFVDPDDATRIRENIAEVVRHGRDRMVYRYRFRRPDGEVRLIEGVALCWFDEALVLDRMLGVVLDITRVDAAHAALTRSEAQLRSVINTAPDAVLMVDDRGRIRAANGAAEAIFRRSADDLIGASVEQLVPMFAAAKGEDPDRPFAGAELDCMLGATLSVTGLRAGGGSFPVEMTIGRVLCEGETLYTGFVRDISERVEAEQRAEVLRGHYLRTARLNAMGAVAAGLAHELNQPLAASANFLAAARLSAASGTTTEALDLLLDQAGQQIALAGDIIRRLRGFLSPETKVAEPLSLVQVIEEARALAFAGDDRLRVDVTADVAPRADVVCADRVQLLQVLVNIMRNAYEAMADSARPAMRIEARRDGDKVRVQVDDRGAGFDPAILGRADTMFVSTKQGNGMGVGLSICRHIVEQWGGAMCIDNAAHGGGQVRFTVPAA